MTGRCCDRSCSAWCVCPCWGTTRRGSCGFATGACGPSIDWNCCREQSRAGRWPTGFPYKELDDTKAITHVQQSAGCSQQGQLQLREALTFWCILPQCLERELVECARRTRDSSTGTPCGDVKQRKHGCEPADIITDIRVCVPRAVSLASLIDTVVGCHPSIKYKILLPP